LKNPAEDPPTNFPSPSNSSIKSESHAPLQVHSRAVPIPLIRAAKYANPAIGARLYVQ
jgi:hypothetical protein